MNLKNLSTKEQVVAQSLYSLIEERVPLNSSIMFSLIKEAEYQIAVAVKSRQLIFELKGNSADFDSLIINFKKNLQTELNTWYKTRNI